MKRTWPAALAIALAAAACSPSPNELQVTVEAYISAVSLGDVARIIAICAPCQLELAAATTDGKKEIESKLRGQIEKGFMQWQAARSSRQLELDPLGVALIRSIGLGKEGAAAMPMGVDFNENNARGVVRTRALTNYDRIGWDSLPSGGRMYLMGHPFGTVVNFATGYDDPSTLKLLATVDLEWILTTLPGIERPPGVPGDWYVEGVRVVPGTDTAWSPPKAQAP